MKTQLATLTREPVKQVKQPLKAAIDVSSAKPNTPKFAALGRSAASICFAQIPVLQPKEQSRANRFTHPEPSFPILGKLAIGAVNDPLESEADAMAEQVMRMPGPLELTRDSSFAAIRRKCTCEGLDPECAECKNERDNMLQRKAINPSTSTEVPAIVHQVLSSSLPSARSGDARFFRTSFWVPSPP